MKAEACEKEEPKAAQASAYAPLSSSIFEAFEESNIEWGDDEDVPDLQVKRTWTNSRKRRRKGTWLPVRSS